jgi:hypothetical protein
MPSPEEEEKIKKEKGRPDAKGRKKDDSTMRRWWKPVFLNM